MSDPNIRELDKGRPKVMPPAAHVASEVSGNVEAHAQGASIVQVETLGKNGVFVLWFSALASAVAIVATIGCMWVTFLLEREVRVQEDMLQHYQILLVEKGIIKSTDVH